LLTAAKSVQPQLNSNCIACGPENLRGLKLEFQTRPEGVASAVWDTSADWEGFKGVIHGGILTTVLDEAMAKAVLAASLAGFTCELKVRFRRVVETGETLQVRGWLVSRDRRKLMTEATLCGAGGKERAHAWATFLTPAESE
jgi:acyl-coenzyme A thioesterase PaaI-like protein